MGQGLKGTPRIDNAPPSVLPGVVRCEYCAAWVSTATACALDTWRVSAYQDCQAPLFYCPNCADAEAKALAVVAAAWTAPEVNRNYDNYLDWLAALIPLAVAMNYISDDQTPETLAEAEFFKEYHNGEYTPAQALKEDLSYGC